MNSHHTIMNMLCTRLTLIFVCLNLYFVSQGLAQTVNPQAAEALRQRTEQILRARLSPILQRYCQDACELMGINVVIDEAIAPSDDLGFESIDTPQSTLSVQKVILGIQVDERVTRLNRDRLQGLLLNNLTQFGYMGEINWVPVTIPQIGQSQALEEQLKNDLRSRLREAITRVIDEYCPDTCLLSSILVTGQLVSPDEAMNLGALEVVRDRSGRAILRVDNVAIKVALAQELGQAAHTRITALMKAKTNFIDHVDVSPTITEFPESYASRRARIDAEAEDPYGLEKLRRMLTLFRDLAGTKEIISSSDKSVSQAESTDGNWFVYALIILSFIGAFVFFMIKYISANKDAAMMVNAIPETMDDKSNTASTKSADDIAIKIKCQQLKQELIDIFIESPKVARETFSRILQEEEVDNAAKYVHLFGHMIIFELLGDPNLEREVSDLAECYHKSQFQFTPDQEWQLLNTLKTRVTANEIRVLTKKTSEKFDFLSKLDQTQVFHLIVDESPQVQSIVLTQLDHKRRRSVFQNFQGDGRVKLMRELCRADAIPKDYLNNVAKALNKKILAKPEFDTQNLRSSDIILDLLEKAPLSEQKTLMTDLKETNPEAARIIKLKLVTLEMLPYLKDGHLLEIILGLDRKDLLAFLSGAPQHLSKILFNKAPQELAESWMEELSAMAIADDSQYRLVELKIISRIRNLASNGAINIYDINDMIFSQDVRLMPREEQGAQVHRMDHMIA